MNVLLTTLASVAVCVLAAREGNAQATKPARPASPYAIVAVIDQILAEKPDTLASEAENAATSAKRRERLAAAFRELGELQDEMEARDQKTRLDQPHERVAFMLWHLAGPANRVWSNFVDHLSNYPGLCSKEYAICRADVSGGLAVSDRRFSAADILRCSVPTVLQPDITEDRGRIDFLFTQINYVAKTGGGYRGPFAKLRECLGAPPMQ